MQIPEAITIDQLVREAEHIVVIQADNPDADSLGSALALEQILAESGKIVTLYCGVDMPTYLRYVPGWDRVEDALPKAFDLSIIVDASTLTLLEKLKDTHQLAKLRTKPCVVLDHHAVVENEIDFATVLIQNTDVASAGELIFHVSTQLKWPLDRVSGAALMVSILGDTQGLSNNLTKQSTYRTMAELTELGVNRTELEEARRAAGKMPEAIFRYKAALITRTELSLGSRLAIVALGQDEINTYSPLYNPAPLIQPDMLQIDGVVVSIVLKRYDDGKVTGAIRTNLSAPIAAELAETLGGGGHPYASGFKIVDGSDYNSVKARCIDTTRKLLEKL
jgi:phosphoesterase RecJ-like protein